MGRIYRLQCSHCQTQFLQSTDASFGVMPRCVGCGDYSYTDQDLVGGGALPIHCPKCRNVVNRTDKEFQDSVLEDIMWG